jgi:polyisoprenyl-phosphate glycosyltransferase
MNKSRPYISIVSPVYAAEKIVDELVLRLKNQLEEMKVSFEIVLVEDRSPDKSWEKIVENCAKYPFVKGIRFSRNFGQHYAITAGLQEASGEYVIVMDCDLQDNPKYIPELISKAKEGNEVVFTHKKKRKHSFFKNFTANIFFRILNFLTNERRDRADMQTGAYSLLSRKAVNAFCRIKDYHRHYLMVVRMLGFKQTSVLIEHDKRFEGKSSYTFVKLVRHAMNGITSQSVRLLNFSVFTGFALFALSIIWALYLIINYFINKPVAGYTSLMVMTLLLSGLILISIGITGLYIGRIFEQVKDRPLYIIDEKLNFTETESKSNG